jgi:hypothetical protein
LAMLAYNLNCWLMLFNRQPQADATALRHTTPATARRWLPKLERRPGHLERDTTLNKPGPKMRRTTPSFFVPRVARLFSTGGARNAMLRQVTN